MSLPNPNGDEGAPRHDQDHAFDSALPELTRPPSIFDSSLAQSFSSYSAVEKPTPDDSRHGEFTLRRVPTGQIWPGKTDALITPQGEAAHDMLRAHILGEHYPCIGARAAFARGLYRFGYYKEMGHLSSVAAMGRDLRRFVTEYEQIGEFTTFVSVFKRPQLTTEDAYEKLVWKHLQMLHEHDIDAWDPHYSPDPDAADFAFSFHGAAFFVVGMHAGASRFSRRFAFPALIFNPESQIRRLKDNGMLERFTATVRNRDTLYQGGTNPSIPTATGTTGGEARVYSGKANPPDTAWKCPFHARQAVIEASRNDQGAKGDKS